MSVKDRFTVAQALQHPWMARADNELGMHHLGKSVTNLKAFNANRKLKVRSVRRLMMLD